MQNLLFNIVSFAHPQPELTFYFSSKEDLSLARFRKNAVPDEVIEHFEKQEHWINTPKELQVIKNRIEKAIDIMLQQNLEYNTRENLLLLLSRNSRAENSDDINKVINQGLQLTEIFK